MALGAWCSARASREHNRAGIMRRQRWVAVPAQNPVLAGSADVAVVSGYATTPWGVSVARRIALSPPWSRYGVSRL